MKLSYVMDISSPVEKVWYWLGTPERAMEWQTNISGAEIIQQTADMVGTTFRETIEENGRSLEMHGVVTDYQENRSLAMHLSSKYNVVDVAWSIEEIDGITRLTVNSHVRFKSVLRVVGLLMRPLFKERITAQLREECARLKELCEAGS